MGNIQTTLNEIFSEELYVSHLRTLFTDMIDVITLFQFDSNEINKIFDYIKFFLVYIGIIGLIITTIICPLNLLENTMPIISNLKNIYPIFI